MNANTITEYDLIDAGKNNAIQKFTIERIPNSGRWRVVVNLRWKEGDLNLVTSRKTVRAWVSLDRLIKHIDNNYGNLPTITINLKQLE